MKKVSVFVFLIGIIFILSSCGIKGNGIEAFGNASFYDTSYFTDTTWLRYEDEDYVYIGSSSDYSFEQKNYMAAFHGSDNYSYQVYTCEFEGIVILHSVSIVNMAKYTAIYAKEDLHAVPGKLIYDFPHHDDWINGGALEKLNGTTYCKYQTAMPGYTMGDYLFTENNRDYYQVIGEPKWIVTPYKAEIGDTYYQFLYEQDATEIPVSIILAGVNPHA